MTAIENELRANELRFKREIEKLQETFEEKSALLEGLSVRPEDKLTLD